MIGWSVCLQCESLGGGATVLQKMKGSLFCEKKNLPNQKTYFSKTHVVCKGLYTWVKLYVAPVLSDQEPNTPEPYNCLWTPPPSCWATKWALISSYYTPEVQQRACKKNGCVKGGEACTQVRVCNWISECKWPLCCSSIMSLGVSMYRGMDLCYWGPLLGQMVWPVINSQVLVCSLMKVRQAV